jgi:S1-C subfamily serine protease
MVSIPSVLVPGETPAKHDGISTRRTAGSGRQANRGGHDDKVPVGSGKSRGGAPDKPAPPGPSASRAGLLALLLVGGGTLAAFAVFAVLIVGLGWVFWSIGTAKRVRNEELPPQAALAEPPPLVAPAMEGTMPIAVLTAIKEATVFVKMDAGKLSASGSGFLIKVDGDTAYFATNDHVVAPESTTLVTIGRLKARVVAVAPPKARISVVLHSGTPREQILPADVVAADHEADLAVLRVNGARDLPKPIDFGQQVALVETMPLFIFGFPFGKALATNKGNPAITVGKGTVSSLRRDQRDELTLVQINGDLNPGNSGGPVVDVHGRLIGVSVAAIKGTQIGMAIPAPELTQLLAGRALGSAVFKKKMAGDSADIHGEAWTLDRFHQVQKTRTINSRLNNLAPGGDAADFEVEAKLLDPMRKIKSVMLLYRRTDHAAPPRADAQGRWAPMPGAQQLPLKIEDQIATGGINLPADAQPQDLFSFQLVLVNEAGQGIYTQPRSFRLNFNPGAVAVGPQPPIGPLGPKPPPTAEVKGGATRIMGGAFDPQFRDDAPAGGLLIGFDVGLGKFFDNDIIAAVQPIYDSAAGAQPGKRYGTNFTRVVNVKAKPGYAVGAITAKAGLTVDGFSVSFMRITGATLDPADAYQSEWIGGKGGGGETLLTGGGTPIVGIVGKSNNRDCTGLGLLLKQNAGP